MTNKAKQYHEMVQKMRDFFLKKNFIEVPTQPIFSILAACEDPFTVSTFKFNGILWPLKQTGQMDLERILLENKDFEGVYCISTSYRNEPAPIPGRHELAFNMVEFESRGTFNDLLKFENELLIHLGFGSPVELQYNYLSDKYNTPILHAEHESRMWGEFGHNISLQNFPERTSPFWNMKYKGKGMFNKADVILFGQETIGSAERSTNPEEMKHFFETVSKGAYANKLYELFGKERVKKELNEFLSLDFFPRFGGGCGSTRLMRALELMEKEKATLIV